MTKITKKTHKIIFKPDSERKVKTIHITKAQYELYSEELRVKSINDFIQIHDIETDNLIFEWRCWKIDEIVELETQKDDIKNRKWVCDYWVRHAIIDWEPADCTCYDYLKINDRKFHKLMHDMGYKYDYPSQINNEMIRAFKDKYRVNWEYIYND